MGVKPCKKLTAKIKSALINSACCNISLLFRFLLPDKTKAVVTLYVALMEPDAHLWKKNIRVQNHKLSAPFP